MTAISALGRLTSHPRLKTRLRARIYHSPSITTTHFLQDTGCVAFPFVDVHPQTIAATLAVSSVPEAVTQAVVVILNRSQGEIYICGAGRIDLGTTGRFCCASLKHGPATARSAPGSLGVVEVRTVLGRITELPAFSRTRSATLSKYPSDHDDHRLKAGGAKLGTGITRCCSVWTSKISSVERGTFSRSIVRMPDAIRMLTKRTYVGQY